MSEVALNTTLRPVHLFLKYCAPSLSYFVLLMQVPTFEFKQQDHMTILKSGELSNLLFILIVLA